MLHNTTQLYGKALGALDGPIGRVKDIYFDDKSWDVRYLIADTGTWLAERLVLLSPHALLAPAIGESTGMRDILRVNLSRQQIEKSPGIDSHRPVSRQFQEEYHRYYGWPSYWAGDTWGVAGYPAIVPPLAPDEEPPLGRLAHDDVHLRNTRHVTGYRVDAVDGTIGRLRDFIVDDDAWRIRELVVAVGHWFAAKHVLIRTSDVDRISYNESAVYIRLTKENAVRAATKVVPQTVTLPH